MKKRSLQKRMSLDEIALKYESKNVVVKQTKTPKYTGGDKSSHEKGFTLTYELLFFILEEF